MHVILKLSIDIYRRIYIYRYNMIAKMWNLIRELSKRYLK